ncbi:MAG: hypothetical protein V1655_01705 [bacterium]
MRKANFFVVLVAVVAVSGCIPRKLAVINGRLDALEAGQVSSREAFEALGEATDAIEERATSLEGEATALGEATDAIEERATSLEGEATALGERLDSHDVRIAVVTAAHDVLEGQVGAVKDNLRVLDTTVKKIATRARSLGEQIGDVRKTALRTRDLTAGDYADYIVGYIVGFGEGKSALEGATLVQTQEWADKMSDPNTTPLYKVYSVKGMASPALTEAGGELNEKLGTARAQAVADFFKGKGYSVEGIEYGGETMEYEPSDRKKNQRVVFYARKL